MRTGLFAGTSFQYEALSVKSSSKTYAGLQYGLILGKDWGFGYKFGLKVYLGLHAGNLVNTTNLSEKINKFSPSLALGLNYNQFVFSTIASFHNFANSTTIDQYLGLNLEAIYFIPIKKEFQFQIGGSVGETLLFSKDAIDYELLLRLLFLMN